MTKYSGYQKNELLNQFKNRVKAPPKTSFFILPCATSLDVGYLVISSTPQHNHPFQPENSSMPSGKKIS